MLDFFTVNSVTNVTMTCVSHRVLNAMHPVTLPINAFIAFSIENHTVVPVGCNSLP